jgi:hypothetical protein
MNQHPFEVILNRLIKNRTDVYVYLQFLVAGGLKSMTFTGKIKRDLDSYSFESPAGVSLNFKLTDIERIAEERPEIIFKKKSQ